MSCGEADEFSYDDPVDGSRAEGQGLRVVFEGGSWLVFRLSGSGTVGATLRVYLEAYEGTAGAHDQSLDQALGKVVASAEEIAGIKAFTGRNRPDVTT